MIDCNEWKTEKRQEYANMVEENDSNYDGNCTARHCLSGTFELSHRWIFVRLSVHGQSHTRHVNFFKVLAVTTVVQRMTMLSLLKVCESCVE